MAEENRTNVSRFKEKNPGNPKNPDNTNYEVNVYMFGKDARDLKGIDVKDSITKEEFVLNGGLPIKVYSDNKKNENVKKEVIDKEEIGE